MRNCGGYPTVAVAVAVAVAGTEAATVVVEMTSMGGQNGKKIDMAIAVDVRCGDCAPVKGKKKSKKNMEEKS
jgi:hypothetical protein